VGALGVGLCQVDHVGTDIWGNEIQEKLMGSSAEIRCEDRRSHFRDKIEKVYLLK
jgi:hypothetical protein